MLKGKIVFTERGAYVFGIPSPLDRESPIIMSGGNGYYRYKFWKLLPKNDYSSIFFAFDHMFKYFSEQFKMFCQTRSWPNTKVKKIQKKIELLTNLGHRKKIVEGIKCLIMLNEKRCNWNADPMLFQFDNAVYDLKLGDFVKPDPRFGINRSCGYEFIPSLIGNGGVVSESFITAYDKIYECILSMFSDDIPYKREFIFTFLSSFLVKTNNEEVVYFFIGDGRNGKGLLFSLLKSVLGDFCQNLDMCHYTKPSSGQERLNAALEECKDAYVLNSSEIGVENDGQPQKFRLETIKIMSGGDAVRVRAPYNSTTVTFVPGKPTIQTNVLPDFLNAGDEDYAIMKRIIIVELPFTFTDDDEEIRSNPNKFKKRDDNLKTLFATPLYRHAFLKILLQHFPMYLQGCKDGTYKKFLLQQFGYKKYKNKLFSKGGTVPEVPRNFFDDEVEEDFSMRMNGLNIGGELDQK